MELIVNSMREHFIVEIKGSLHLKLKSTRLILANSSKLQKGGRNLGQNWPQLNLKSIDTSVRS